MRYILQFSVINNRDHNFLLIQLVPNPRAWLSQALMDIAAGVLNQIQIICLEGQYAQSLFILYLPLCRHTPPPLWYTIASYIQKCFSLPYSLIKEMRQSFHSSWKEVFVSHQLSGDGVGLSCCLRVWEYFPYFFSFVGEYKKVVQMWEEYW